MSEFNLLQADQSVKRDVSARLKDKETNRRVSCQFGEAYFDGPREQGYGGYSYDGRWQEVARRAAERYGLKLDSKVLDIGCAKGFFVHDLREQVGAQAFGIDISKYAISHAEPDAKEFLQVANATELPFEDDSFDAVFSINVIHNLEQDQCIRALKEMNRVCKWPENCFVQVDAYRNDAEKELFEAWMLTAKTYLKPDEWQELFSEAGYEGDYFWTILEFDE